jgi:hypothetical protein
MRILFEVSALEESPTNALRHYEIEFSDPVNADWLIYVIRQALDAAEQADSVDAARPECGAAEPQTLVRFSAKRGEKMFDYFVRKPDFTWFNTPKRPLPPLFSRPVNSKSEPTATTPIGQCAADCELVKLTDEQLSVWRAA